MHPSYALQKKPARGHWVALAVLCGTAWLCFCHGDILETGNHSYILLECLFSGKFFQFYDVILAHETALFYINGAHYNILLYLLFALAELPVYLVNQLLQLSPNGEVLSMVGKLVSIGFFAACLWPLYHLARLVGLGHAAARWCGLFFMLWPPAFFAAAVMGQYDAVCLFFMLWALVFYLRGRLVPFVLLIGVAAVFKFFALIVLVPLLLLAQKKPLRLIGLGLLSLWLLLPSMLLFHGRSGESGLFTVIMIKRLFEAQWPAARALPAFGAAYAVLCVGAYVRRSPSGARATEGLWVWLASMCLLFLLVPWHPQWFILLAPPVVLTTMCLRTRTARLAFTWADIALSIGFFLSSIAAFPRHFEDNLFDFALPGTLTNLYAFTPDGFEGFSSFLRSLPWLQPLAWALLAAALLAHLVLKLPRRATPLADALAQAAVAEKAEASSGATQPAAPLAQTLPVSGNAANNAAAHQQPPSHPNITAAALRYRPAVRDVREKLRLWVYAHTPALALWGVFGISTAVWLLPALGFWLVRLWGA